MAFDPGDEPNEIDAELEQMCEQAGKHVLNCRSLDCFEEFGVVRTRAENEGRALYFVNAIFMQMTQAGNLLQFRTVREYAIQLISLLQKPEEIYRVQPDFPEDLHEFLIFELSPCAYENLADAAGELEGYNSNGLQDSISGGIQVCRNIGKPGCIQCFREYAAEVYLAADDLELVRHQCQNVLDHDGHWQNRGNRRYLAMTTLGWLEALQGDFEGALEKYEQALKLTGEQGVNVKLAAQFEVLSHMDEVRLVLGLEPMIPNHEIYQQLPEPEQVPRWQLKLDQLAALQAAIQGETDVADQILSGWDRKLSRLGALALWFENRLRLLALRRQCGGHSLEGLAETLEEKATRADDWLTIRRLNEIMDGVPELSLLGIRRKTGAGAHPVNELDAKKSDGPSLAGSQQESMLGESGTGQESDSVQTVSVQTDSVQKDSMQTNSEEQDSEFPLKEMLAGFRSRIFDAMENGTPEQMVDVVADLQDIGPEEARTLRDTQAVLFTMSLLINPQLDVAWQPVWKWANRLAARFQGNGVVLSLLAAIGNEIRLLEDDPENSPISADRLEQLFNRSLELEKNGPLTYTRAGAFFLERGEFGQAEKCFARGFKLDRTNPEIVLSLAEVYEMTQRERDALHVVDLSLREGCASSDVCWRAMQLALMLRRFEALLTYVDTYHELVEPGSPSHFFRGIALLNLERTEEALESFRLEREDIFGDRDFHCCVGEAVARLTLESAGHLRQDPGFRELLDRCLETPLVSIDYIPFEDVVMLHEMLWKRLKQVDDFDEDVARLESRMLIGGFMPDEYFDELREEEPESELKFIAVLVEQSLGEDWPEHPGCHPGQESWGHYLAEWGVVAADEDEAREMVAEIQRRCYDGPVDFVEVVVEQDGIIDIPGIVFQGRRLGNDGNLFGSLDDLDLG